MKRRWGMAEIHILEDYKDAPRERLLALLPGRTWRAIGMAMLRYDIHRMNNVPRSLARRHSRLLDDLTMARVQRRIPQKCLDYMIGTKLSFLEGGHKEPSFARLQKWCDALGLELRALPKVQAEERAA